ncbi:MAG: hypothetical protein PHI13_03060 [Methylococcales bacterium]|nr:hypothetical protein [Methylococcales bacterium]
MPTKSYGNVVDPMAEPVTGSSSSGGTPVGFRLTRVKGGQCQLYILFTVYLCHCFYKRWLILDKSD